MVVVELKILHFEYVQWLNVEILIQSPQNLFIVFKQLGMPDNNNNNTFFLSCLYFQRHR